MEETALQEPLPLALRIGRDRVGPAGERNGESLNMASASMVEWARVMAALADIYGELVENDRVPEQEIGESESRLGLKLPKTLRELYRHTGRHRFHQAHNKLVLPAALLAPTNGMLIFYKESQGVSDWALDLAHHQSNDPPVCSSVIRNNERDYVVEFDSLSAFISFQAAWQGVDGGLPFVGVVLAPRGHQLMNAFSSWERPLARTAFAEVRFGEGVVATYSDDGYLGLATRSAGQFVLAGERLGVVVEAFDYATLRDE